MRRFANVFLILFLIDGIVSSIHEVLFLATNSDLHGWLRSVFSWPVIIFALPMYVCLGIDRRLPKLVLLPQILLVFWSIFDLWPLSVMFGRSAYMLPASICQLVLGIAPLLYLKMSSGQSWLLPSKMFAGPFFKLRNTLTFFLVNLLILPVALAYMAISFASLQLYDQTGGFARLWPNKLQMTEKVYRHAGKEIRLTSMIHVADRAYFDAIVQSISSDRTIVLAEGVTDKEHHLAYRFSYGKLARNLGLTSQEKMVFNGKFIEPEEIQTAASTSEEDAYHILRADIDMNDFDPKTIEFLNIIGKHILNASSKTEGFRQYMGWIKENSGDVTPETIMKDILHKRNEEVIGHMARALDHYDTIIIPWGALHMPEIEMAVLEKNFHLKEIHRRTSIDFKKMLMNRMASE